MILNGISGQTLYDNFLLLTYNLIWTALPIFASGIFDKDVEIEDCLEFPELYKVGQNKEYYNVWLFIVWMSNALFQSIILFYVAYFCTGFMMMDGGRTLTDRQFGVLLMGIVYLVANIKVFMETKTWNIIHFAAYIFTILIYPAIVSVYHTTAKWMDYNYDAPLFNELRNELNKYYFDFFDMSKSPFLWLLLFLTIMLTLIKDLGWKS
jgi:magnesium-transporting ATPase (P-type)